MRKCLTFLILSVISMHSYAWLNIHTDNLVLNAVMPWYATMLSVGSMHGEAPNGSKLVSCGTTLNAGFKGAAVGNLRPDQNGSVMISFYIYTRTNPMGELFWMKVSGTNLDVDSIDGYTCIPNTSPDLDAKRYCYAFMPTDPTNSYIMTTTAYSVTFTGQD